MFLQSIRIHNYKSLRHIDLNLGNLACLVGPNAAGKSNFSDALHFVSEVYTHGLEAAVARKGGYENIAHRKKRRSRAPITFDLLFQSKHDEFRLPMFGLENVDVSNIVFRYHHRFSFRAESTGIKAEFHVENEDFTIASGQVGQSSLEHILKAERDSQGEVSFDVSLDSRVGNELRWLDRYYERFAGDFQVGDQELVVTSVPARNPFFVSFTEEIAGINVFRFNPELSKTPGVPTPNPQLEPTGENLPALVDWLQSSYPDRWQTVITGIRDMVPNLEEIGVKYTHRKTLGLIFHEKGVGRPWVADDISDGTIQGLAMLVASVDPRTSCLIIEEPENSVHPWIIRTIIDRFREVSKNKTVIFTTHSPMAVDRMKPEEVWLVSKSKGETDIHQLSEYESDVLKGWQEGEYRLSEVLDSGLLPDAVPGGPE